MPFAKTTGLLAAWIACMSFEMLVLFALVPGPMVASLVSSEIKLAAVKASVEDIVVEILGTSLEILSLGLIAEVLFVAILMYSSADVYKVTSSETVTLVPLK